MRLTPLGSVEEVWHSWCIWRQKCRKFFCHPHNLVLCHPIRMSKTMNSFYSVRLCLFHQESEFLDKIQTKVLRVFHLAIHSNFCSFAWRFLFLQTHATSYNFYSSIDIHNKGDMQEENLIEYHSNSLINQHRNLKSDNSQDYDQNLNQIVISWIRLQASVLVKNCKMGPGFYSTLFILYEDRRYTLISYHVLGDKIV